jgi:cyclopropane-fatty-acyl-phospholipid synthase
MNTYEKTVRELFRSAQIPIDGTETYSMRIHNPDFYRIFLSEGTLGLGESYMLNMWDCQDLPELFNRFSKAKLSQLFRKNPKFILNRWKAKILNQGNKSAALLGVRSHYDIGNDLFKSMLDSRLVYTCAYWNEAQ